MNEVLAAVTGLVILLVFALAIILMAKYFVQFITISVSIFSCWYIGKTVILVFQYNRLREKEEREEIERRTEEAMKYLKDRGVDDQQYQIYYKEGLLPWEKRKATFQYQPSSVDPLIDGEGYGYSAGYK